MCGCVRLTACLRVNSITEPWSVYLLIFLTLLCIPTYPPALSSLRRLPLYFCNARSSPFVLSAHTLTVSASSLSSFFSPFISSLIHHSLPHLLPLFSLCSCMRVVSLRGPCYPAPIQTSLNWEARQHDKQTTREEERLTARQLLQQDWQAEGKKNSTESSGKAALRNPGV